MPPTWVGVSEEVPWPRCGVEYDARWPQSQPRQVRQSSLRDRSAGPPRGEARPTRAARDSDVVPAASQTQCRRRGSESVKRSLGQGAGWTMTRVGRKANHAKSASARALRVGRPVSNGAKRARAVRHGPRSCKNVAPKPQPSAWNGVGAEGPWPTAWDGACRALAAKTTTPSPPVRVASWPVGRSSTWRSSPDPRVTTGLGRCACSVANSMPPTWVGVSEEEP